MFRDITRVSQLAKEASLHNDQVINATIGVLLDDNGEVCYSKVFDEAIDELTPNEKYTYAEVSGPKSLNDKIIKFVGLEEVMKKPHTMMITQGGTGAISNIFSLYSENTSLLITDLCWINYLTMAKLINMPIVTYPMFQNNHFNLQGFSNALEECLKNNERVIISINTPSQNPTGYDMSSFEIEETIRIINSKIQKYEQIIVLLDMAYYSFGINQDLSAFSKLDNRVVLAVANSFSKSLGIYGLRMGSLTIVTDDLDNLEKIEKKCYSYSRTKWSSPNKMACSAILKLLSDQQKTQATEEEINKHREILKKRCDILKEVLDNNQISYYPHTNGFFLSIPVDDPEGIAVKLTKEEVYITTVEKGIRVAIAGVPTNKVSLLGEKISKVLKEA